MTDYHSTSVVDPKIPLSDMSPLELFLLTQFFQSDLEAEGLFLYAEQSIDHMPTVLVGALRQAYADSLAFESQILPAVRLWLDEVSDADADSETDFDLDAHLNTYPYEVILQDIVRRSPTLSYLTVEVAHTCTKMRPDGFGGSATLIHAEGIEFQSTSGLLEMAISALKLQDCPAAG
ncbi:hypothetical protein [Asticcacaulis excentricus]|uniref:Uncharacterized protein n=1 Tax=Asticcacaulis excentricus (strain ATCC 15261 / DSM 4724 / KCTC 12464 / NCIMB 9791 / VKM B-1370 / CB 48) TaxID=573065 RepID=E8RVU4_ASTEC|nr:hypothetical protein [Asticcacaulis excentricus]ADU15366.1 hypothetical protein Astex_3755 [Asticcacaulis excentricus CB 48]